MRAQVGVELRTYLVFVYQTLHRTTFGKIIAVTTCAKATVKCVICLLYTSDAADEGLGVAASVNSCRLMNHDLDRSLLSVFGMCRDLRSLACCNLGVVTNSSQSTVVDSLRGFGVQAYHTFDGGFRTCGDRDDLAEGSPVQSLIDKHKIGS